MMGLTEAEFERFYRTEEQCRDALISAQGAYPAPAVPFG